MTERDKGAREISQHNIPPGRRGGASKMVAPYRHRKFKVKNVSVTKRGGNNFFLGLKQGAEEQGEIFVLVPLPLGGVREIFSSSSSRLLGLGLAAWLLHHGSYPTSTLSHRRRRAFQVIAP